MQNKKIFSLLFLILTLTSCTEKAMISHFNENIETVNDFNNYSQDINLNNLKATNVNTKTYFNCQKSSINAKEVKSVILAKLLSKSYNTNVQTDKNFAKSDLSISIDLKNVCLEQVLDYLIQAYDIGHKLTSYGYVLLAPKLETKVFRLDYHNFNRSSSSSISITGSTLDTNNNSQSSSYGQLGQTSVSPYGSNSAAIGVQPSYSSINTVYLEDFWDNIEKTLNMIVFDLDNPNNVNYPSNSSSQNILQNTAQVSVHRNTGIIVIKSYPSKLQLVEEFLQKVNGNTLKQVVIEAKILEITLNEEFGSGIQWELLKKKLYLTSFNDTGSKSQVDNIFKTINLVSADSPVSTIISGKISNGTDFASVIQALSVQGKVSILSSPRVSTLNNQRALIKYGDEEYYLSNISNTLVANSQSNSFQTGFSLNPFFSGIALDATPHILSNNEILLHIHPIITRVTRDVQNVIINGQKTELPLPKVQSREADAILRSASGDIVILGGLSQGSVNLSSSGLPINQGSFLRKILMPFTAKQNVSTKSELVILLKPTIISVSESNEAINSKSRLSKYLIDTSIPKLPEACE